jgi:hypothetical protein
MHITYVAPLQSGDCRGAQRFERAGKIELSNYGETFPVQKLCDEFVSFFAHKNFILKEIFRT